MFTFTSPKISAIPTTLITGFLGVGKTTAILQLLANKPKNENWAILVNEFGEVGIDSALLARNTNKKTNKEKGVFIREVPGGCMCCASGLPMQVALNQLITQSKPDRLIIEPTGLGHPKEVVDVLTRGKYQDIIDLQTILCLIDARNLSDTRYTEHPSFVQQLNIADIILASKSDTYCTQDHTELNKFIREKRLVEKNLHYIQQGKIDPSWLTPNKPTLNRLKATPHKTASKPRVGIATSYSHDIVPNMKQSDKQASPLSEALQTKLAQNGYIELNNHGEGYFSKGWIFTKIHTFNYQVFMDLITSLNVTRAKGVVLTNKGSYSFNKSGSEFHSNKVTHTADTRIELIDTDKNTLQQLTHQQWLTI